MFLSLLDIAAKSQQPKFSQNCTFFQFNFGFHIYQVSTTQTICTTTGTGTNNSALCAGVSFQVLTFCWIFVGHFLRLAGRSHLELANFQQGIQLRFLAAMLVANLDALSEFGAEEK